MLGATAFVLGVAGLFGSAAMMGAENRSSSAGGYGIPSETDNDVSAQVRTVRRKWSGIYNNQRGEWVQPAWHRGHVAGATQKDLVAACLRG